MKWEEYTEQLSGPATETAIWKLVLELHKICPTYTHGWTALYLRGLTGASPVMSGPPACWNIGLFGNVENEARAVAYLTFMSTEMKRSYPGH